MAVIEACARLLPGVLGNEASTHRRVAQPGHRGPARVSAVHAARPSSAARASPRCSSGGNHAEIARWRRAAGRSRAPGRAGPISGSASARPRGADARHEDDVRRLAIALVHHPVLDGQGAIVTTAVTNLDVHDLARSARTYGCSDYFVVHPIAAQRELVDAHPRALDRRLERQAHPRPRARRSASCGSSTSLDAAVDALGGRDAVEVWVTAARELGADALVRRRARAARGRGQAGAPRVRHRLGARAARHRPGPTRCSSRSAPGDGGLQPPQRARGVRHRASTACSARADRTAGRRRPAGRRSQLARLARASGCHLRRVPLAASRSTSGGITRRGRRGGRPAPRRATTRAGASGVPCTKRRRLACRPSAASVASSVAELLRRVHEAHPRALARRPAAPRATKRAELAAARRAPRPARTRPRPGATYGGLHTTSAASPRRERGHVAHVAAHDLAAVGPAVGVEVAPRHRRGLLVDLDEDDAPRRAEAQQREAHRADARAEVEGRGRRAHRAQRRRRCGGSTRPARGGGEPGEEQRVDVGAVPGPARGWKRTTLPPKRASCVASKGLLLAQRAAAHVAMPARATHSSKRPIADDAAGRLIFRSRCRRETTHRREGSREGARARVRRRGDRASRREPRARHRALRGVRRRRHAREMAWLARHHRARALRLDGEEILAGARSVVCLARRYQRHAPTDEARRRRRRRGPSPATRAAATTTASCASACGASRPSSARSARPDHPAARAAALRRRAGARARLGGARGPRLRRQERDAHRARRRVDGPARRGRDDARARAGRRPCASAAAACTRCLDACPTRAFAAPFVLDAAPVRLVPHHRARRAPIPPTSRPGMGEHLFGCDDCQTVCPFNAGAGARAPLRERRRRSLRAPRAMVARCAWRSCSSLDDDGLGRAERGDAAQARGAGGPRAQRGHRPRQPRRSDRAPGPPPAAAGHDTRWCARRLAGPSTHRHALETVAKRRP